MVTPRATNRVSVLLDVIFVSREGVTFQIKLAVGAYVRLCSPRSKISRLMGLERLSLYIEEARRQEMIRDASRLYNVQAQVCRCSIDVSLGQ